MPERERRQGRQAIPVPVPEQLETRLNPEQLRTLRESIERASQMTQTSVSKGLGPDRDNEVA